jgi:ribosomal protein L22
MSAEDPKKTSPESGDEAVADQAKQAKETASKESAAEKKTPAKKPAAKKAAAEKKPTAAAAAKAKADAKADGADEKPAKKPAAKAKARADDSEEPKAEKKPAAKKADAKKPAAKKEATKSEPKPAAAPSRRRRGARSPGERVVVRAQARYVRSSARKARLVCDAIRGKDVVQARAILAFHPRAISEAWMKLLDSAVANAENNHDLVGEDLRIVAVYADEGPTIKRFRPRAMGRATRIRKRTSHLTIQLTPKETS